MAGLTHLAIGLTFTLIVPKMHVIVLVVCAYLIDIIFLIFMFAGIKKYPKADRVSEAPWSHSLLMAIIWSVLAVLITIIITKDFNTGILIGLLVFSHWIVDFIAKPMTIAFPNDGGILLHPFRGSPEVELGLWKSNKGIYIGEYGSLIIGSVIFIITVL